MKYEIMPYDFILDLILFFLSLFLYFLLVRRHQVLRCVIIVCNEGKLR